MPHECEESFPGDPCGTQGATPTPTPEPTTTPTPDSPPPNTTNCTWTQAVGTTIWYWDCNCPDGATPANFQTYGASGGCPDGKYNDGHDCCRSYPAGGGGCAGAECPEWELPDGYEYDPCACISPVLVDVWGDGFRLTGAAGGVRFDFNGDGRRGLISWTEAGSDDSWLVLDRDGDGVIDNGMELFGNATTQPHPPAGQGRNGFLALAEYDRPGQGGNADGVIDARDRVFPSLRLWRDVNHNGVSEPDELHTLQSLDVARLHLGYKESKRTDEYGNRFRYRAKVDDARGAKVNRWAWDVFLVAAP